MRYWIQYRWIYFIVWFIGVYSYIYWIKWKISDFKPVLYVWFFSVWFASNVCLMSSDARVWEEHGPYKGPRASGADHLQHDPGRGHQTTGTEKDETHLHTGRPADSRFTQSELKMLCSESTVTPYGQKYWDVWWLNEIAFEYIDFNKELVPPLQLSTRNFCGKFVAIHSSEPAPSEELLSECDVQCVLVDYKCINIPTI